MICHHYKLQHMKGMILAAGLGTRLHPYTAHKPKALVTVGGITLLERAINKLIQHGFQEIVINIHHFGELILQFLAHHHFNCTIHVSDERDLLLNTGGGISHARPWLTQEPFLVYNTDILTNLNLKNLYQEHCRSQAIATLAIRKRTSSRYLLFDNQATLVGWRNTKTGEIKHCRNVHHYEDWAFSGIHVIDPKIFDWMPQEKVFSIIDVYLKAGTTEQITGFDHSDSKWMDVGRIPDLERAQHLVDEFLD